MAFPSLPAVGRFQFFSCKEHFVTGIPSKPKWKHFHRSGDQTSQSLMLFPQTHDLPETWIFAFHPRTTLLPQIWPQNYLLYLGALPSIPNAPAASPSWKGEKKSCLTPTAIGNTSFL